jgi:micrococcal nuclease
MATFLTRAFTLAPAASDFFTDDAGSIFESDINAVAQAGIAVGYGDGTYRPNDAVTREEMASFLARAMGLSLIPGDTFVDVAGGHEPAINAIAAAGVTVGCDPVGPRYCPTASVIRDQMATFLTRARGLAPVAVTPDTLYAVASITDGDTFRAIVGGVSEPVRLIGMDTPEVGQCLADQATAYLSSRISGQSVRMIVDVSDRDGFGRLLRYVMIGNVFVNGELVRQGYATAIRYPPDTFMATYLEALQGEAQAAGRGIWGSAGACPPPPPLSQCHASYPTVCIRPPPPDLDCADIPYRNFKVLPPDPHNFDGNNDGVGCET